MSKFNKPKNGGGSRPGINGKNSNKLFSGFIEPNFTANVDDFYFQYNFGGVIALYGPYNRNTGWSNKIILSGSNGTNGTNGEKGTDANKVLPSSLEPTLSDGNVGDYWLQTGSANNLPKLYGPKTNSGWNVGVSLVGPSGSDGVSYADENKLFVGPSAPDSMVGKKDDYYIKYDNSSVYQYGPKTTDTQWPNQSSSLKGLKGRNGLIYIGIWDINQQYTVGNVVIRDNIAYECIFDVQGGQGPGVDNANWQLLSSKGEDGLAGERGSKTFLINSPGAVANFSNTAKTDDQLIDRVNKKLYSYPNNWSTPVDLTESNARGESGEKASFAVGTVNTVQNELNINPAVAITNANSTSSFIFTPPAGISKERGPKTFNIQMPDSAVINYITAEDKLTIAVTPYNTSNTANSAPRGITGITNSIPSIPAPASAHVVGGTETSVTFTAVNNVSSLSFIELDVGAITPFSIGSTRTSVASTLKTGDVTALSSSTNAMDNFAIHCLFRYIGGVEFRSIHKYHLFGIGRGPADNTLGSNGVLSVGLGIRGYVPPGNPQTAKHTYSGSFFPTVYIQDTTGNAIYDFTSTPLVDSNWHHIAAVYYTESNISYLKLYLDGINVQLYSNVIKPYRVPRARTAAYLYGKMHPVNTNSSTYYGGYLHAQCIFINQAAFYWPNSPAFAGDPSINSKKVQDPGVFDDAYWKNYYKNLLGY